MKVTFNNNVIETKEGTTVSKLLKKEIENNQYQVVACRYNNEYMNLETEINENAKVELIDTHSKEGMKVYVRTLVYIMGKAFESLYPQEKLMVEYQLGNAMFCRCDNLKIAEEFIQKLKSKMQDIIDKNLKIKKVVMNREEAEKFFKETHTSKGKLQIDLENNY